MFNFLPKKIIKHAKKQESITNSQGKKIAETVPDEAQTSVVLNTKS